MKLLDQVRNHLRLLHYSYRTEQSYVGWIERFIHFHKRRGAAAAGMAAAERFRHPRELGAAEGQEFLTYLAARVGEHAEPGVQRAAVPLSEGAGDRPGGDPCAAGLAGAACS